MDSFEVWVEAKLLYKLHRRKNWGESHTAFEDWVKRGLSQKEQEKAKKIAEELVKENFVFKKPTSYGLHVSLNPKRAEEIKQKIKAAFNEFVE